jgi:general secretion pathway protein K
VIAGHASKAEDSQRGSALLVVLLMLGLIAVLASVVARSVSGAALTLGAARMAWQSEADLQAGVELGAATILSLGEDMRSAEASIELADRRIDVRVTNERARIDLNAASAPVLARLLEASGVLASEAAAIADGVIEWRAGPEPPPAMALLKEWRPVAASRFIHPAQLASVLGFPASLAKAVLPLVTVASGSARVDAFIASGPVLKALPGSSAASIDAFLKARDGNSGRETATLLLGVEKTLLTDDPAPGWRIEVRTRARDGRVRRGEAVIAILAGESEPYRVLYVMDEEAVSP